MKNTNFQVKTSDSKEGKTADLIIAKEFCIHNVENIKAELDKIAGSHKEFNIRIDNPESFDLAALQLLVSFRRSMEKDGKTVKIHLRLPAGLDQIVAHSGIKDQLI